MFHSPKMKQSKASNKSSSKSTSICHQNFYSQVDIDSVPSMIRQKILLQNIPNQKILKLKVNPHGWVVAFYIAFLNTYFTQKKNFQQHLQRIFDLLDDDEFKFLIPQNKNSFFYIDWSNSKIKRMMAEYFKDISDGKFKNVCEILEQNHNFNKILFLFSMTVLFYCQRVEDFDQFINLQTCKETLFDYFDIDLIFQEGTIVIPSANLNAYIFHRTDIYLTVSQGENLNFNMGSMQSIPMDNAIDNEQYDLKLQIISNHGFQDDLDFIDKKEEKFEDPTKNVCNIRQFTPALNTYKSQIAYNSSSDFRYMDKNENKESQQKSPRQCKNKIVLSTQSTQWTSTKNNNQFQIDKLFELTGRQATTQKSLYDDPQQAQQPDDEYSFLDQYVPPSRKSSIKKIFKQNVDTQQNAQQNQTLINKWYQFINEKRQNHSNTQNPKTQTTSHNIKTPNIQNLVRNSVKKITTKHNLPTLNQKPDFKKVKARRRNTQQSESQQKTLSYQNTLKSMKSQTNLNNIPQEPIPYSHRRSMQQSEIIKEKQLRSKNQREGDFILQNPYRNSMNDQILSRFSEIKITQQFTDSVILQQLNEQTQANVKMMKIKARQQRDSLKFIKKERKTVQ